MQARIRFICLILLGVVLVVISPGAMGQELVELKKDDAKKPAAMMKPLDLEESLQKARFNGKYMMLLRQFKAEKDAETYKDFTDAGVRDMPEYMGETGLPRGHWVYVYPYWYIWRELAAAPKPQRAWGFEQVVGPPNTVGPGDIGTAWASRSQDEEDEWLLCEYAEPVQPAAVLIYETYNPGAVVRVTAFKLDGKEVEVWAGEDPLPPEAGHGVSVIPFKVDFKTNRVKVYINSPAFPGWNEIDAVGLRDTEGRLHWTTSCDTSTTYAQQTPVTPPPVPIITPQDAVLMERIQVLEREVRQLRNTVNEMNRNTKSSLDEIKEMLKKQTKQ
jgi:hypothetical protein